ncbi:MAG: ABC transporter ATP-binding protein [Actinomycetota bacterium]|nr:ABC transporter ATP-binding protein [Actinomycetota bacterium]
MTGPAVAFDQVSKRFRIWHEKHDSLKARLVNRGGGRYSERSALESVNLTIPAGITYGLVGANGAGKSTALKLIAEILVPDSGTVAVNGKVSALLELGAGFHPDLTGRENVYLNGSILGLSQKTLDLRFDDIAQFAEIGDAMDHQVKTYSSGMHARLGFAVAVHVEPDILVIDEALSVGDAAFQRRCAQRITELRRGGRTVIIVSHDLGLVRTLCDRAALFDRGHLAAEGSPGEIIALYERSVHSDAVVDDAGRIRFGNGAARILDATIHRPSGEPPRNGEPTIITIDLGEFDQGRQIAVGVNIRRNDGVMISQTTTRGVIPIPPTLANGGTLAYEIPSLAVLSGSYVLHTWLFDDDSGVLLDAVDHRSFDIEPADASVDGGAVALGGTWRLH